MVATINEPLIAKLLGGPMDGDEFDLIPNGSMEPPHLLAYERDGRLMVYKAEEPDWEDGEVSYVYRGNLPSF